MNRRGFLLGAASLLAAPAIVRVGSIMPVKALVPAGDGVALYSMAHPFIAGGGEPTMISWSMATETWTDWEPLPASGKLLVPQPPV